MTNKDTHHEQVIESVSASYGFTRSEVMSGRKFKSLVMARHLCMFILRESGRTFDEIAWVMCKGDHTTAIHACRKITRMLVTDRELAYRLDAIRGELGLSEVVLSI